MFDPLPVTVCITLAHVLCHNVDGLFRDHSVQLDQLLMPELLHNLSFLQKGLWRHGAGLQGLNGNPRGPVPRACQQNIIE